jgi:PhzF family phenazine biosynthesis protein
MEIFQVDAFTKEPFKGNPAGVCILSEEKEEQWMQNVAREMNLSETAFLVKEGDGYRLRWFTPAVEVNLCGHATLASAHILWERGHLSEHEEAIFHTKSGKLTARKNGSKIEMDFPATPPEEVKMPEIEKILNVKPVYTGKYGSNINTEKSGGNNYLAEVEAEEMVRNVKPDFALMNSLGMRAIIVTSPSTSDEYDFISRFFAPGAGVNEDPVTGSAHCCLGPYWSGKLGKTVLTGYQASSRGGVVGVEVAGDRVILSGHAITVIKGELLF